MPLREPEARPVRTINVLHGSAGPDIVDPNRYRTEIQKAAHLREVMRVESPSKKAKIGSDPQSVAFTDEDLQGVQLPHNDALVVTLRIAEFDVKRLLID